MDASAPIPPIWPIWPPLSRHPVHVERFLTKKNSNLQGRAQSKSTARRARFRSRAGGPEAPRFLVQSLLGLSVV